ncbi:hypothetical protein RMATCC62417_01382 [Rhizopus microsporus]|nr:hypothetical protein RMATCC62417_01382 [Rhizopus microsporus]
MSLFDDFLESTTSTSVETQPIPIPKSNRKISTIDEEELESQVWKSHLQQKNYEAALRSCKLPTQRAQVYAARAQEEYEQKRYLQSAQYFAKSNVPFDQVVIKFIQKGEKDALRQFLIFRIERLDPNNRTQKTLIATWLVEMYLSKMDQLDDLIASAKGTYGSASRSYKYLKEEQQSIKDEFRSFIETFGTHLHASTTYKLISKHGRNAELLYYADYIGDAEKVLDNWIREKDWERALNLLGQQDKLDLIYKYSTLLIEHVPEKLVDLWIERPALNSRYLIPALLRYNHSNTAKEVEIAMTYL